MYGRGGVSIPESRPASPPAPRWRPDRARRRLRLRRAWTPGDSERGGGRAGDRSGAALRPARGCDSERAAGAVSRYTGGDFRAGGEQEGRWRGSANKWVDCWRGVAVPARGSRPLAWPCVTRARLRGVWVTILGPGKSGRAACAAPRYPGGDAGAEKEREGRLRGSAVSGWRWRGRVRAGGPLLVPARGSAVSGRQCRGWATVGGLLDWRFSTCVALGGDSGAGEERERATGRGFGGELECRWCDSAVSVQQSTGLALFGLRAPVNKNWSGW